MKKLLTTAYMAVGLAGFCSLAGAAMWAANKVAPVMVAAPRDKGQSASSPPSLPSSAKQQPSAPVEEVDILEVAKNIFKYKGRNIIICSRVDNITDEGLVLWDGVVGSDEWLVTGTQDQLAQFEQFQSVKLEVKVNGLRKGGGWTGHISTFGGNAQYDPSYAVVTLVKVLEKGERP